jgi:hypothetical protein
MYSFDGQNFFNQFLFLGGSWNCVLKLNNKHTTAQSFKSNPYTKQCIFFQMSDKMTSTSVNNCKIDRKECFGSLVQHKMQDIKVTYKLKL